MKKIVLLFTSVFMMDIYAQETVTPQLTISWATQIHERVAALEKKINSDIRIPTGTIIAYYGGEIPKGWMLCDGSTIPSDFDELKKLVGPKVPDLRGVFLRGANNGRDDGKGDIDTKRIFGSYQIDEVGPHVHSLSAPKYSMLGRANENGPHIPLVKDDKNGKTPNIQENSGLETRPKNVAVNFLIKI